MPGPYDPTQTCLGIPELATWLHITERHVRRFVAERRIPFHKIGGRDQIRPVRDHRLARRQLAVKPHPISRGR